MTKQKEKKKASIVKKMMIAVVAGFVVGFICLLIKSAVMGTDGEGAWKVVEAILFQDITATKDIEGLGLFYIVGQLFMKGLQMMIVPLVLCSLTLALCSLANPKKLGRIAGKTFVSYLCFYIVAAALAGAAAYLAKSLGWFTVNLPAQQAQDIVTMEGYNPLVTIVNAVPSNMINAMSSNNTILCVVVTKTATTSAAAAGHAHTPKKAGWSSWEKYLSSSRLWTEQTQGRRQRELIPASRNTTAGSPKRLSAK